LIEFKLTTLAGFVLVPFGLWGKSAFLAERVLGFVVTCGIKVLVLAVIVGIGSTLFGQFVAALPGGGQQPTIGDALALMLAAAAMLGLGIFGPTIASGLVSGAPQLGAGAAVGTAGALAAGALVTGGTAAAAIGLGRAGFATGLSALRAGTSVASGAAMAYQLGAATSGETGLAGVAGGLGGVGRAGVGLATGAARSVGERLTGGFEHRSATGRVAAWQVTGGRPVGEASGSEPPAEPAAADSAPTWARRLRAEQARRSHVQTAAHAVREGDHAGSGANPDLERRED